jgi:hypothetical protein
MESMEMLISGGMDTENVGYFAMEFFSAIKKNK